MSQRYIEAREKYGNIGVDTEQAIEKLQRMEIAMHC